MTRTMNIRLSEIEVRDRLRPLDQAHVEQIAASMAERGQLQPIIVTTYEDSANSYTLVAGYHRLAAVTSLNQNNIRAEICTPDEARFVEIDENLCRHELTPLDRAIFIAERKRLWEEIYPEAAHGKAKKPKDGKVANLATFSRFSKDAAKKTGLSERSIQRASAIAKALHPAVIDMVRQTPIAGNQGQLQALADLTFDEQLLVAQQIADGKARNVASAKIEAGLVPRPRAEDKAEAEKQAFLSVWARASTELREFILTTATQWKQGETAETKTNKRAKAA